MKNKIYDCIIIGAGPGGIGASINLFNNGVDFLLLEKSTPGGKVNVAPRVDNYPGYKAIPGPELAYALFEKLLKKGISITFGNVISLTKENELFIVQTEDETYTSKTVIIASGTTEKKLGLDKEVEFLGKGISYCAICDGFFYKNKVVAVAGGGNSAFKEAIHLTHIASKVYLIHRRNEFRGSNKNLEEFLSHENAQTLTPCIVEEILGEDHVEGIKVYNKDTDEHFTLQIDGFFPCVGYNPNTEFVKLDILDEYRNVIFFEDMKTKVPGCFAAGDVLPRALKQIYLSERDGIRASNGVIKYLKANESA